MRRRVFRVAVAAAASLPLLVLSPAAHADHPERGRETRLKVLTFNIFYGGDDLDLATGDFCDPTNSCDETFRRVVATVRASDADVVGVQEPDASVGRLARALGWYADERAHVVSRFPLTQPPEAEGRYVYVEVAPGRAVAVANLHLPSDPYGPYAVRDGATLDEVGELERTTRLPAVEEEALAALRGLRHAGVPVIVTGDFNSPSHLDWTPAVAATRPDVPFAVDWPVSRALVDAGLRGEPGGPDVDVAVARYPSDHRAVVSTLAVRPVSPPAYVAVGARRVEVGDRVAVAVHSPGHDGAAVDVVGPTGVVRTVPLRRRHDLELSVRTAGLAPGRYDVALRSRSGAATSVASFWL